METNKKLFASVIVSSILLSTLTGGFFGYMAGSLPYAKGSSLAQKTKSFLSGEMSAVSADQAQDAASNATGSTQNTGNSGNGVVNIVEKASPAVVSIIITKDLPIIEKYYQEPSGPDFFRGFFGSGFDSFFSQPQYRQNGTQKQEVGGGSGFIVSSDGYILTNKHVVDDPTAQYTVLMNDETKHEAKVLAKDTVNDIAVLKVEGQNLPHLDLGDSSNLKVGQSVITIGNALGEFRNTVSTGVISGLARNITAGEGGMGAENLIDVIQTDAAINPGNSGGPLLDDNGKVIGINTAVAEGAQNIGFSLPVNAVKDIYESVKTNGRIVRPWLGVRYVMLNPEIAKENNLAVEKGALVLRGSAAEPAVIPGSPASKAGLQENDVITQVNGKTVDSKNSLANLISGSKVGDTVEMKIRRGNSEKTVKVKLEEMKQG